MMDLVDLFEEFKEGFLSGCPYQENVVLETGVGPMPMFDSGENILRG